MKQKAADHPLFAALSAPHLMRGYMQYQMWCVWDFMVLTKSIQRDLQGHASAWLPSPNPAALRCINAILEEEETDQAGGFVGSHFELFLLAMQQAGLSTARAEAFCDALRAGLDPLEAMDSVGAPKCARIFVAHTLTFSRASLPERAAILLHSREDLVPRMLQGLPRAVIAEDPGLSALGEYVDRHISLDTEKHAGLSQDLFRALSRPEDMEQALATAVEAIEARIRYLDAIAVELGV